MTSTTKKEEGPSSEVTASDILKEGLSILQDRGTQRDCPNTGERSMASTIKTFNSLTGHNLTEAEGWEFMVILKMVRGRQGNIRADDYVDLSSYGALLGECKLKTT